MGKSKDDKAKRVISYSDSASGNGFGVITRVKKAA